MNDSECRSVEEFEDGSSIVQARPVAVIRTTSIDELAGRARRLATPGTRRILGITGAPGAGKSTLAAAIIAELGGLAVSVPMDEFHLTNSELERLGRRDRKGAPDTFDAEGYVALLRRLRVRDSELVYAPEFSREAEEPLADAMIVTGWTSR